MTARPTDRIDLAQRLLKPFATRDGDIGLLPCTDRQRGTFFDAAGFGEAVKSDPRFADDATRAKHTRELYDLIEQAAAAKTTQAWLDSPSPSPW